MSKVVVFSSLTGRGWTPDLHQKLLASRSRGGRARSIDGSNESLPQLYPVMELKDALSTTFDYAANFAPYSPEEASQCFRIRRRYFTEAEEVLGKVRFHYFVADVDYDLYLQSVEPGRAVGLLDFQKSVVREALGAFGKNFVAFMTTGGLRLIFKSSPLALKTYTTQKVVFNALLKDSEKFPFLSKGFDSQPSPNASFLLPRVTVRETPAHKAKNNGEPINLPILNLSGVDDLKPINGLLKSYKQAVEQKEQDQGQIGRQSATAQSNTLYPETHPDNLNALLDRVSSAVIREGFELPSVVLEGSRDTTLLRYARSLLSKLAPQFPGATVDSTERLALLRAASKPVILANLEKCKPPLPSDQVKKILWSAFQYASEELDSRAGSVSQSMSSLYANVGLTPDLTAIGSLPSAKVEDSPLWGILSQSEQVEQVEQVEQLKEHSAETSTVSERALLTSTSAILEAYRASREKGGEDDKSDPNDTIDGGNTAADSTGAVGDDDDDDDGELTAADLALLNGLASAGENTGDSDGAGSNARLFGVDPSLSSDPDKNRAAEALLSKIAMPPNSPFGEETFAPLARSFSGVVGSDGQLVMQPVDAVLKNSKLRKTPSLQLFQHFSEVEVAKWLASELAATPTHKDVIYYQGNFLKYSPETHIWEPLETGDIRILCSTLDKNFHVTKTPKGEEKVAPITIKKTMIDSAVALLSDFLHLPDSAIPKQRGVVFNDVYVYIEEGEAVPKVKQPEMGDYCFVKLDGDYSTDEPALFDAFLRRSLRGPDAAQRTALLWEFIGASLLGLGSAFQTALLLFGDGQDGKSTFLEIWSSLFPQNRVTAITFDDLAGEYYRAELASAYLNVVGDIKNTPMRDTSFMKRVIDGTLMTGRGIRDKPIQFRPRAVHAMSTNIFPSRSDFTKGFERRIRICHFNNPIPDSEVDRFVQVRIVEKERAKIASKALRAVIPLLKSGSFTNPASSQVLHQTWRKESDQIANFVASCASAILNSTQREKFTPQKDIYAAYRTWAMLGGYSPLNMTNLLSRLTLLKVPHDGMMWGLQLQRK